MTTKLSVNVNKVATLRNTRPLGFPSVLRAAELCLQAGAHGITVHPRPDERHIRPDDVVQIAALLQQWPQAEYNIEGNPFEGAYLEHIQRTRPAQCTLVPDTIGQSTSDHGWDLASSADNLRPLIAELHKLGCRVSLFMDPLPEQMAVAAALGADRVELYTAPFAEAHLLGASPTVTVQRYRRAAEAALAAGLGVNAGHDLSLSNLGYLLQHVPGVLEVSIGHALIGEALEFGLPTTVRKYLSVLEACK